MARMTFALAALLGMAGVPLAPAVTPHVAAAFAPPAPAYVMGGRLPRERSPGTRAKQRWKRARRRRG